VTHAKACHSCVSRILEFPPGQSLYTLYAFQIHAIQVLWWSLELNDLNHLILYSKECSGIAKVSLKGKEAAPLPCTSCVNLQNHTVIMGIQHPALDGAHKHTPWSFLSAGQILSLLQWKSHFLNHLKLQSLNAVHKIGIQNQHLAEWKQLSMAVGHKDIPCIQSLMATQHHAGASVFTMLKIFDQAAWCEYSPCGYQITDFQWLSCS
jgi:hypothetical protein